MATFLEVVNSTLLRVDEESTNTLNESTTNADVQVLKVVMNAINQGYVILRSKVDRKTTAYTTEATTKIVLPEDFIDLTLIEHEIFGELSPIDYEKRDNFLIMKNPDFLGEDIEITYVQFPTKLVADTDVLVLKDAYIGPLTSYGAYVYQVYKKKYSAAQMLLQEFNYFIPQPQINLAYNQQQQQQTQE